MSEIEKVEKIEGSPKPDSAGICLTGLANLPDMSLLDDRALGKALGVHPRTIRRMVQRGELPPGIRQAGKTLWLAGKVKSWIAERAEQAEQSAKREFLRLQKFLS